MSRGPGRVQQVILAAIADQAAAATRDDGTGPEGVRIEVIWQALYGTQEPTRAQRQSVQHAIGRLGPEVVQATSGRPWTGKPRVLGTRTRTRMPWRWELCMASTGDCLPCSFGSKPESPGFHREVIERERPGVLKLALQAGIHVWPDQRPEAAVTETIKVTTWYGAPAGWIARPSTEAELAAKAEQDQARKARFLTVVSGRER